MDNKITIVGAGNGGKAIAGYLALKGYDIALYSPFKAELKAVEEKGGIQLQGKVECFGKINLITNSIKKAIGYSDMIFIITPAFAHENIVNNIAKYVTATKSIVLIPGHFGGILSFRKILIESNSDASKICIAETNSLPYACRIVEGATVHIYGIKEIIKYSMYNRMQSVIERLENIFPTFVLAQNILEAGISDMNPILHPIITILNIGRIEQNDKFRFYMDGVTSKVAKLAEKIDQERLSIANSLDIQAVSLVTWLKQAYGIDGNSVYEVIRNNQAYYDIWAPDRDTLKVSG